MAELRHPPGTFDVLPAESGPWQMILTEFARVVERAGYGLIITPTFEDIGVFRRLGESTDVVRKEMYDFRDKGDRHIALRPEVTAAVVRAFIQHRPVVPWKAWYAGSQFRYERPAAGRFREFHQLGIEAFGSGDADLDVEVIALAWEFYRALGIARMELLINSLGDRNCRPRYRELLLAYLRSHRDELCDDHRNRLDENPMRVLDCKKPECRAVVANAPRQLDHLCDDCAAHWGRVVEGLESLEIPFTVSPLLVRGLDYYTRTTFEFAGRGLESAQNALGGGGRYDDLVAAMGGPETPAVGFALGMERIILALQVEGLTPPPPAPLDAYLVDSIGGQEARDLSAVLRRAGFRVDRSYDNRSFKSQFKAADRSGARLALIIGPDEAERKQVKIKDLKNDEPQDSISRDRIIEELHRRLG
ncbi:MAG TPA: histidine--tRNA ligase [Acidimicrobiales bacterium]|jgi:histidyl-tRNA synthetase|nr:histidine--tRNA ligase [Acidimicrobiales bacterium]